MQIPIANYMLPAMQIVCHLVGPGTGPDFNVTNLAVDQTTPQPQPTPLPEGYFAHPDVGFAYKVYTETVTWMEARNRCSQKGAQLALIDTTKKVEYVERQGHTEISAHNAWPCIGQNPTIQVYDDKMWVAFNTGLQLTSLPWKCGQPYGYYDCVRVSFGFDGLAIAECTDLRNYVCEIPILKNAAIPAN